MWFNIPLFPERAATLANQVDYLYFFLILNTVFFTLVVAAAVAYFAMRYRRAKHPRAEPIHGALILEPSWSIITFMIARVMFWWGAEGEFEYTRPAANDLDIYGTGKDRARKFLR